MTDDSDAMWRPGYEPLHGEPTDESSGIDLSRLGLIEHVTADAPPASETATTSDVEIVMHRPAGDEALDVAAPPRARRWWLPMAIVAVSLVAVGAVAVARNNGDDADRPDVDDVAGADIRRLPASSERLWTADVDLTDGIVGEQLIRQSQFLIDGRSTAVVVLATADDSAVGIGVDALTGIERWRRNFDFEARAASLLGVLAGNVVIEQNDLDERRLIGVDIETGDVVWSRATRDNGVHVILSGTEVVTRVSFTGTERLTFIDPTTGDESAPVEGRLIGNDLAGTWYVEGRRRISAIDLSSGPSEPTEIAASDDGWFGPTVVVDGRIIVLDDDGTLAEFISNDEPFVPLVVTGGELPDVESLVATGGPTAMAIGDGKVLGINLDGTTAEIMWSNDASVRVVDVTARGMLIALSDATGGFADGADLAVIDPLTGERLAAAGPASSTDELPRLLGDGFVISNTTQLGREQVGYDLDGAEVWRLPNNDPIRIGDRVMLTVRPDVDGYALTAFGDPE